MDKIAAMPLPGFIPGFQQAYPEGERAKCLVTFGGLASPSQAQNHIKGPQALALGRGFGYFCPSFILGLAHEGPTPGQPLREASCPKSAK